MPSPSRHSWPGSLRSLRAVCACEHYAWHVDKGDVCRAGLDGLNGLRGALARNDGDVEAFVPEITFRQRGIPGRMPPERNEIQGEDHLGRRFLLRDGQSD